MTTRSRWIFAAGVVCAVLLTALSGASGAAPSCVDLSVRQWAVRLVPDEARTRLQFLFVVANTGPEPARVIPRVTGS